VAYRFFVSCFEEVKMRMLPTRTQWENWSFQARLGVFSAYIGFLGFILSIVFYIFPIQPYNGCELPSLPGGSGWLLLGDYNEEKSMYSRCPFFKIKESHYSDNSTFPRKGDILKITIERNHYY
jgi:hypothetical protein